MKKVVSLPCVTKKYERKMKRDHINLRASSLKKLWRLVAGKHKLSPAAKDRLALFAGFQSWKDLDNALHGDADASVNYD